MRNVSYFAEKRLALFLLCRLDRLLLMLANISYCNAGSLVNEVIERSAEWDIETIIALTKKQLLVFRIFKRMLNAWTRATRVNLSSDCHLNSHSLRTLTSSLTSTYNHNETYLVPLLPFPWTRLCFMRIISRYPSREVIEYHFSPCWIMSSLKRCILFIPETWRYFTSSCSELDARYSIQI